EQLADHAGVHVYLLGELLARIQERERMVVGLPDELATPGVRQPLEQIQHVRAELAELLQQHARHRVRDPEPPLVPAHQVEDQARRGAVALVRDLEADLAVLIRVEVEVRRIEDRVPLQAAGLMDLKIEDDAAHAEVGPNRKSWPELGMRIISTGPD